MTLRHPPAGEVWIHIDQFGKKNGRTWAVQDRTPAGKPRYRTAKALRLKAHATTRTSEQQPKAVLVITGATVTRWPDGTLVVTN